MKKLEQPIYPLDIDDNILEIDNCVEVCHDDKENKSYVKGLMGVIKGFPSEYVATVEIYDGDDYEHCCFAGRLLNVPCEDLLLAPDM